MLAVALSFNLHSGAPAVGIYGLPSAGVCAVQLSTTKPSLPCSFASSLHPPFIAIITTSAAADVTADWNAPGPAKI